MVSAAILCTGGPDVIRKDACPFYRTSSGVRLCWEIEEPKGPKGPVIRKEAWSFLKDKVRCPPMVGVKRT